MTNWQMVSERGFTPTGQVAWEKNGAGNTTSFTYDPADRLFERADPLNRRTRFQYDLAGQMLQEVRAFGTAQAIEYATYTYSPNGQRLSVVDANGNRSEFVYDGFDRLERWHFPHKSSTGLISTTDYERYEYDPNGNRTLLRKRDAKAIRYAHDALNRLTRTWYTGVTQAEVHRTYDLAGRPNWVRFDSLSGPGIQYQYNDAKNLLSEASFGRTVSFQYDAVYNRTRLTFPDNHFIQYDYDALNRVTHVRENGAASGAGVLAVYSYDPLSRREKLTRGNATITDFTFDLASRLTSMGLGGTNHDAVFSYNWTVASQLARRQSTNGLLSGWPVAARNDTYAVNGLNQYTQVTGRTYVHDDNGNLINNGIRNYAYDVENRLVSVSGAPSMTLSYDPLGRLKQTVANGQTVQFVYDGDRLIAEYNGSGTTVLRRYVHGPGIDEPIVWYEGSALNSNTRRWLHTDERGSVIAHSNGSGTATTYSYGPYGEPGNDNWTGSRFRYTGQIALPEARLYHYKARVYDPIDGRFLQTDPIGYEDQMNLYAYAWNDPINATDPTGECTEPGSVVNYLPACLMANTLVDYYRGFGSSIANSGASVKHTFASMGWLGESALTRATVVNLGIEAASIIAANNSGEVGKMLASRALEVPIGQRAGQLAGGPAPLFLLTRGASFPTRLGWRGSNYVSLQLGAGVRALNGLLDHVSAAGIDPSIFANETLGNAVLAGAAGAKLSFDSKSGALSATFTSTSTGSRIQTQTTIQICKVGEDGTC